VGACLREAACAVRACARRRGEELPEARRRDEGRSRRSRRPAKAACEKAAREVEAPREGCLRGRGAARRLPAESGARRSNEEIDEARQRRSARRPGLGDSPRSFARATAGSR